MKKNNKNNLLFKEIVLEETQQINGGLALSSSIVPGIITRTSGMVATTDELFPLSGLKIK